MESTLRPRDIQARIRAGESAEQVAQAARTTVEKILPFAQPVLAEREHVAQRAQASSVRRRGGAEAGGRTLGQAVAMQLRNHGAHADDLEWDSWRREDGRWTLTTDYVAGSRTGTATFAFDLPGNYVLTENDDARWLIGDLLEDAAPAPVRDDLQQARERRLSQPPALPPETSWDEAPHDAAAETVDLTETAARVREAGPAAPTPVELAPTPEPLADAPRPPAPAAPAAPAPVEPAVAQADEPAQEEPRRPAKNKRGRASVPSWDEIMFGGPTGSGQ